MPRMHGLLSYARKYDAVRHRHGSTKQQDYTSTRRRGCITVFSNHMYDSKSTRGAALGDRPT